MLFFACNGCFLWNNIVRWARGISGETKTKLFCKLIFRIIYQGVPRTSVRNCCYIKGPIFLIIVYEPSFSLFIAFYMSFLRFSYIAF